MKQCRACGAFLTPISTCSVCKENIGWICTKCEFMQDVTHTHPQRTDVYAKTCTPVSNTPKT